jgi:hypothetical protein
VGGLRRRLTAGPDRGRRRRAGGPEQPAERGRPAEAPAGDDPSPANTFFSLGFGGSITLGFDNPICNGPGPDIEAREITLEPYPNETVNVFVSNDGVNFVLAGQISKDGSVGMPASVPVAHYVKLVDITDRAPFANDPAA